MLKRLFTSSTRIKLLSLFLLNPDEEFFIRELTRKLDEQINSIRRELDNLKKMGLLKSKERNRKKYYVVNKNFIVFHELKNIIMKAMSDKENLVKKMLQFGDLDVIVLAGQFVDKEAPVDLLVVGTINRESMDNYLHNEMQTSHPVRFSLMTRDDYVYRRKCKDKFLHDIVDDPDNIVALNRLEKAE